MAKVLMNKVLQINRRFLSAAAESVRIPSAKPMTKVSDSGIMKSEPPAEPKQRFWMKDPNTGYWIPENHFGDIDVAELRDKLLAKKQGESRKN